MSTLSLTNAMLTDYYQVTISLAQWRNNRHNEHAVFDLFYRIQPFGGSFAIFAGLKEAIEFVKSFKFTEDQLAFLKEKIPDVEDEFIDYLRNLRTDPLKIYALREGTVCFPREPLMRIEGPCALCQLIETPLLNCINFATLMATNAARFRLHCPNHSLVEFGLRRAQGPDGALSASRYSYMGGFDGTSNLAAAHKYDIPAVGTVAHSFICSYNSIDQVMNRTLKNKDTGEVIDLYTVALKVMDEMKWRTEPSELASFVAQAVSFPDNFLALVDTYNTMGSGVPNFLAVGYGLYIAGHKPKGIRLDSGDLAQLSKDARKMFIEFCDKYGLDYARSLIICASNDINEGYLAELGKVGHEINSFGVGTHLVTCQSQPALGCVYKLVEINGQPRVKISNDVIKMSLPAKKVLYRLYDKDERAICDLLALETEEEPISGRVRYIEVWPDHKDFELEFVRFERLYTCCFDGGEVDVDEIRVAKDRVTKQIKGGFNNDVLTVDKPIQYHLCISKELNKVLRKLMQSRMKY